MRIWLGLGAVVVVGVAGLVWVSASTGADPSTVGSHPAGDAGGGIRLVSYPSCAGMLAGLRQQAAGNVGMWGAVRPGLAPAAAGGAGEVERAAAPAAVPPHSATNDYVPGADEPDLVKTAGNRVITVEGGVLRVVDTTTRTVTARLKLVNDQTWGASNLLVEGNRALVILAGRGVTAASGGPIAPRPDTDPTNAGTRYVLVDLSGSPMVLGTLTPSGDYVDARLVGSTVRLVVRSQPNIAMPQFRGSGDGSQQLAQARAAVRRAPITAWLPKYQLSNADGAVSSRVVPCRSVSHPADYTGTSLLTIYSIDLAAGLDTVSTVSLAADGDTVYATTDSLYIASNPQWWYGPTPVPGVASDGLRRSAPQIPPQAPLQQTQIHRFDISRPGAPRYVASGEVSGRLLNQYSLSDYAGYLRVATTTGDALADEPGSSNAVSTSSSSVYVLRADTLTKVGELDGLGKQQRIYAVRFIGALGYVVTFQQMDPLYTLDLRDPTAPRIAGALELTGYSAYLHPASDRTLIGIGQEATAQGRPLGLQISLFDVSDPVRPRRIAHLVNPNAESSAESDPRAFVYWPQSEAAVLPVNSWTNGQLNAGALVLSIAHNQITEHGTLTQPTAPSEAGQTGITRSLIIGPDLWTVSDRGLMVNELATLSPQAWIPHR